MSSLFTHKYTQMMIIKFILIYEDNITNVLQQINRHNFSDHIKVRSFWKLRNRDKIVGVLTLMQIRRGFLKSQLLF